MRRREAVGGWLEPGVSDLSKAKEKLECGQANGS